MGSFTKTVTERQLAANRANAQKSTGPRSPETKAKVAQNRVRHGLTGAFRLLPTEDPEQYNEFLNQCMLDEKPVGIIEVELVKTMAQHLWMSRRADCLQTGCFNVQPPSPDHPNADCTIAGIHPGLELFMRYQAHHYRVYEKASRELQQRRKERQLSASRFQSQQRAAGQEIRREKQQDHRDETHALTVTAKKIDIAIKETRLEHLRSPHIRKMAA
jgi:hypothetical protein